MSWKTTYKIGLHVYIRLRAGVAFLGKKMSANQNAHATFFSHVKKIVQTIKMLIRQIQHVKNIVCSEIRNLFQPKTTRKSLCSYNKIHYYKVEKNIQ